MYTPFSLALVPLCPVCPLSPVPSRALFLSPFCLNFTFCSISTPFDYLSISFLFISPSLQSRISSRHRGWGWGWLNTYGSAPRIDRSNNWLIDWLIGVRSWHTDWLTECLNCLLRWSFIYRTSCTCCTCCKRTRWALILWGAVSSRFVLIVVMGREKGGGRREREKEMKWNVGCIIHINYFFFV